MRKLLVMSLLAIVMLSILMAAMPVTAVSADWPGAPCGAVGGEPPGWSQVSKGEGGSGSPGVGPYGQ